MTTAPETVEIGTHSLSWEADTGFVKLVNVGEVLPEDTVRVAAEMNSRIVPGQPVYWLIDNTRATSMSAEARKTFSQNSSPASRIVLALYGGSFSMRTMANLMFKALAMTGRGISGVYHADENTARAWLQEQQRALSGKPS